MSKKINKLSYKKLLWQAWVLTMILEGEAESKLILDPKKHRLQAVYKKSVQRLRRRIDGYNNLFDENISVYHLPYCVMEFGNSQ